MIGRSWLRLEEESVIEPYPPPFCLCADAGRLSDCRRKKPALPTRPGGLVNAGDRRHHGLAFLEEFASDAKQRVHAGEHKHHWCISSRQITPSVLDYVHAAAHSPCMDSAALLNRLIEAGFSQLDLAARLHTTQQSVSRWARGDREPSGPAKKLIIDLAAEVGLLESHEHPARVVRVMGRIGAGAHIEPDAEQVPHEGLFEVELPFTPDDDMIAFQIEGGSMLPDYRSGDVIVVREQALRPIQDLIGDEVAVRTYDGKRFFKRLFAGSRPHLYNLVSKDAPPMTDVRLTWASEPVAHVRERQVRILPRERRRRAGIIGAAGRKHES